MSLANKFGIPQGLLDAAKKALEEANEYQKKVQAHMAKKGIKSMSDMTPDQKKKFFNELDVMHTAKHEEVEHVEEELKGDMHPGAKKVLKHIKPEHHGTYKPYLKKGTYKGDYKDRAAVLSAAEKAGHVKEEVESVELTQEDLDFIASLNQIEEGSGPKEKQHDRYVDRDSEESKEKVKGARERMASDEKAKAGKKLLDKIKLKKEDVSLEDFTVEEIEEFMQTEDYDQLDELSKETLGSYVKKRSHDVATQGALTRKHAMDSEAKKKETGGYTTKAVRDLDDKANRAFMKGWKHRQNIARAVDKIVNKA